MPSETQLLNQAFLESVTTPGLEKRAIDAVNDFTRTTMREDGFHRRIMAYLPISNDELDRSLVTPAPIKIIDKEPGSPASLSVPFADQPVEYYIRGARYQVTFGRIMSPRFTVDVDELRTWIMDIRQVISDNSIKDMLAEEDSAFIAALNTALVGQGSVVPYSGKVQWQAISGGIDRDTMQDSLKIMPRTPSRLEVRKGLVNNITIREFMKWRRDEVGGDFSQDVLLNGWSRQEFMNVTWEVTIKQDLVPENRVYYFADEKFIGRAYELEATTMNIKRDGPMIEFYNYETIGASIGHTGGLAAADFT